MTAFGTIRRAPGGGASGKVAPAGQRLVAPPAATLQALYAAANAHRRAETALLASLAVGDLPLGELHPVAVGGIVRSLRGVGEEEAARLFAIEVAIAAGL